MVLLVRVFGVFWYFFFFIKREEGENGGWEEGRVEREEIFQESFQNKNANFGKAPAG